MKTDLKPCLSPAFLAAFLLLSGVCHAAGPSTKDHVLFVGSDFTIQKDGTLRPVVGAGNRTFVVQVGDKRVEYPLRELKDIRVSRGLKLTNLTAAIDKVDAYVSSDVAAADAADTAMNMMVLQMQAQAKVDKAGADMLDADFRRAAYTPEYAALHPSVAPYIMAAIANAEGIQNTSQAQYAAALSTFTANSGSYSNLMIAAGSAPVNTGDEVELTPQVSDFSARLNVSALAGNSPGARTGAGTQGKGAQPEATAAKSIRVQNRGGERSDRFDLAFTLSSPQAFDNAYAVLVTEYSAPQYPGQVFRRVLTQPLGHVGPQPKKVEMYQTFFPEGFSLRTFTLELYADGQEIATNLSETKMTLTRDEAYEYIATEYLANHKGETLPPAAVLMAPRSEVNRSGNLASLQQPVYVSVDKEGKVLAVATDPKRSSPPPPDITAALEHFKFMPALEKGVPVAGRAKLVVADFAR